MQSFAHGSRLFSSLTTRQVNKVEFRHSKLIFGARFNSLWRFNRILK